MTKSNLVLWVPAISGFACFTALIIAALAATGDDKDDRQAAAEYQQQMVDAGHWDCAEHDKAVEAR